MSRGAYYTFAQKQWLKANYHKRKRDEIMEVFPGRKWENIRQLACSMGLKATKTGRPRRVSDQDIEKAMIFGMRHHLPYLKAREDFNRAMRHLDKDTRRHLISYYATRVVKGDKPLPRVTAVRANRSDPKVVERIAPTPT
jgi:hypothetical protein